MTETRRASFAEMAILKEKQVWRTPRKPRFTRLSSRLTPEETARVLALLRELQELYGGFRELARQTGLSRETLARMARTGRPTAGMAVCLSQIAGMSVDELLTGAWPAEGNCPMCGRLSAPHR